MENKKKGLIIKKILTPNKYIYPVVPLRNKEYLGHQFFTLIIYFFYGG